mmetsp:Transcript_97699/g.276408  ORF Transcript_97699/g.276408 Transcript_97699/m.276408 type:complete len:252 (+) Transcript_97699:330-1085(+)
MPHHHGRLRLGWNRQSPATTTRVKPRACASGYAFRAVVTKGGASSGTSSSSRRRTGWWSTRLSRGLWWTAGTPSGPRSSGSGTATGCCARTAPARTACPRRWPRRGCGRSCSGSGCGRFSGGPGRSAARSWSARRARRRPLSWRQHTSAPVPERSRRWARPAGRLAPTRGVCWRCSGPRAGQTRPSVRWRPRPHQSRPSRPELWPEPVPKARPVRAPLLRARRTWPTGCALVRFPAGPTHAAGAALRSSAT